MSQAVYEKDTAFVSLASLPQPLDQHQGAVTMTPDGNTLYFTRWAITGDKKSTAILQEARRFLARKKSNQTDTKTIRSIKGLIRRGEARATCRYVGIAESNIHFMDLPFYETGTIEKKPMSEKDVKITIELLKEVKPHQVYCAGDFADPHGTHIVCFNVVLEALRRLRAAGETWINDCWLWLYKGAWQEWNIAATFLLQQVSRCGPYQCQDAR